MREGLEAVGLVHRGARVRDGLGGVLTGLQDELQRVAEVAPEVVQLLDLRVRCLGRRLDGVQALLAAYAEGPDAEAVDNAVDNLTTLLEPMIMAVLGVLVGGLLIGMYLPIFNLGNVL